MAASDSCAHRKTVPSLEMAARDAMRTVTHDHLSVAKEERFYERLKECDDCIKEIMADLYDQRLKVEDLEQKVAAVNKMQQGFEATYHRVNILERRVKVLEEMIASK